MQRANFAQAFPGASAECLSLLSSMLQFDPRRRIGVGTALEHPWLAEMHDPATEATAPGAPLDKWIRCIRLPVAMSPRERASQRVVDGLEVDARYC